MNRYRRLFSVLCLLLALMIIPLHTALGFGDFDSGSDSGGSDWDSGSDWSSDRSGSSSRSSGGKGSGSGTWLPVLLIFAAPFVLFGALSSDSKKKARSIEEESEAMRLKEKLAKNELLQRDPLFSEDALIEHVKRLFTEMQTTWEAGDIGPVQYGFTSDAWNRFNTQLQMKNQRGEVTHVRDISFMGVDIIGIHPGETKERLTVRIVVAYNVWVTNRKGSNIQGSPSTRHKMDYRWTMERPAGAQTEKSGLADRKHCPNCGAELDVAAFAECPFCKAQIGGEWKGWLLSDIQLASQETLHR